MKKLLNKFKKSIFFNVFNKIRKKPSLFFLSILFDVLFFFVLYGVGKLIGFNQNFFIGFIQLSPYFFNLYLLFLLVVAIVIYSFFKLSILDFVANYFNQKLRYKRFFQFFLLNLIVVVSFLIISYVLYYILPFIIKGAYLRTILVVLIFALIFFTYFFIHFAHTFFITNLKIKVIMIKSFKELKKLKNYGVIIVDLLFLLLFFLIYYIIIKIFFMSSPETFQAIYPTYVFIFSLILATLFYILNAYNRIYFYYSLNKK